MRYMLDTNIFIYLATDVESLSRDIRAILQDYDNTFCVSAETTRELIVGFRKHSFSRKTWKSSAEMLKSLENEYFIEILPIDKSVAQQHAQLQIDEAHGHNDPSDHIIIAHAISVKLPLISSDTRFPFYRNQGLELIENKSSTFAPEFFKKICSPHPTYYLRIPPF